MPLLLLLFLLMPSVPFAQAGSSTELGDSTFYNFGGLSGSSQSIGDMEFSRFSNGVSGMRSRIGDINFYSSSTPGPSELLAAYGSNHNKYIGRTKMKSLTVPIISLSLLGSACDDANQTRASSSDAPKEIRGHDSLFSSSASATTLLP